MPQTVLLIPHYNNLDSLAKTLRSINHSEGLDVLVIDDGSDEDSIPNVDLLQKELNSNVNLELKFLKHNGGIAKALNFGLEAILKEKKHEFIARIDCGDVCVSDRFEIQENFLYKNKEVVIVGSWVNWLDSQGELIFSKKPPTNHKEIKRGMSIRCSLIHPSTMFRVSLVENVGNYPCDFEAAEDYAYFYGITNKFKVANIGAFLTSVEFNHSGISSQKRKEQSKSKLKIIYTFTPLSLRLVYSVIYNIVLMSIGAGFILNVKKRVFKW
jgi:glycosyltransferase involved in cell wall biosynthesis